MAGGWGVQGKPTDSQDIASTQIDQGPRDSDSVDLIQDLEPYV